MFNYFEIWFNSSTFPTYGNWKSIVKNKVRDLESRLWLEFCSGHPNMHVAQACLENVSPSKFWSLADLYPDLVSRLHIQIRLIGNLCVNGKQNRNFRPKGEGRSGRRPLLPKRKLNILVDLTLGKSYHSVVTFLHAQKIKCYTFSIQTSSKLISYYVCPWKVGP